MTTATSPAVPQAPPTPNPTAAPLRARQSYRHEAFLWHDRADYLAGLVPFVLEGLDLGEAVLVGATGEHQRWLVAALGPRAAEVRFVDVAQLACNPVRIMPALLELLDECCGPDRPARGVGEPIWPGRSPAEVSEAQLHEALLNLAVDPDLPFWLICPYGVEQLDAEGLADLERSHPVIATATSYAGSGSYRGRDHARALFTADLPDLGEPAADLWATEPRLDLTVEQVTLEAASRDLLSDRVVLLTTLVRGLVAEGARRGADGARLRLWDEPEHLVCEVADRTVVDDFLIGRRTPAPGRHDAVWSANQACDLVQVRSNRGGTSVRLHLGK